MRKLIATTFITLDGDVSAPEKWSGPYWDEEYSHHARELLFSADTLLLGRKTYEGFAETWPALEEAEGDYAVRMNALPKYVASRTLTEPTWNTTLIKGDVAEEVAALKRRPGKNIVKYGIGGELDRTLLEHKLVDEYQFWMFPVIAGSGERILDGISPAHLRLKSATPLTSGIVLLTYTPK